MLQIPIMAHGIVKAVELGFSARPSSTCRNGLERFHDEIIKLAGSRPDLQYFRPVFTPEPGAAHLFMPYSRRVPQRR